MKSSSLCVILLAGVCTQCSHFPSTIATQDIVWSGEYHFKGFGFEADLDLNQDGLFTFSSSAHTGSPDLAAGSWVLLGEWIVLSPSIPWIRENQHVSRLQLRIDDSDQYLIPEGFNVSYLDHGWKPIDTGFVRGGVRRRSAIEGELVLRNVDEFIGEMSGQQSWCGTCNPGAANTQHGVNLVESPPSRSDFDWIVCGETTMAQVRSRLGKPSSFGTITFGGEKPSGRIQYYWPCVPFTYYAEEDLDWEWGPAVAARMRVERTSADGSLVFVVPSHEDGTTLPSARLTITFHQSTMLVLRKEYSGPHESDKQ